MNTRTDVYTKEFFKEMWGKGGYVEDFSYGVGIDEVCRIALEPFFNPEHHALEIGPGGGSFTKRMAGKFKSLTALDVIPMPEQFRSISELTYIELSDRCFICWSVPSDSIDFAFSYNCFCHFSDDALRSYIMDVGRVVKPGGHFVFMLCWFEKTVEYFPEVVHEFVRGDLLPTGHFYQDPETVSAVVHPTQWQIESVNMIPDHRDLIVHLIKK